MPVTKKTIKKTPTSKKTTKRKCSKSTKTSNSKKKDENLNIEKKLEKKLNSFLKKVFKDETDFEEMKTKAISYLSDKKASTKKQIKEIEDLVKKHPSASLVVATLAGVGLKSLLGTKKKK